MGVLNVKDFGAIGDGVVNDKTAIQDAIDAANDLHSVGGEGGGITVLFPRGIYKIDNTLTWKPGAILRGEYGPGESYPIIAWHGTTSGKAMIETDFPNGMQNSKMERLALEYGGGTRADHGLVFKDRADLGTYITDVRIQGCQKNGVRFEKGGINVHCHRFAVDGCLEHAVYWKFGGSDTLSLDKFAVDNTRTDSQSGGALRIDGSAGVDQYQLRLSVRDCRVLLAKELADDNGCFQLDGSPDADQKIQLRAIFDTVYVAPGSGDNFTGLLVDPPTDFVDLTLRNCEMSVSGVPTYARSLVASSSNFHTFTAINPHGLSANAGLAAARSATELYGDLNVQNVYQHGEPTVQVMQATTSDFDDDPVTINVGQCLLDPDQYDGANTGRRVVKECSEPGTLGTLTDVKGNGTGGTNTLKVKDGTAGSTTTEIDKLKINHYISFGINSTRILSIDASDDTVPIEYTLTLYNNLASNYVNEPVSFTAPLFVEHTLLKTYADAILEDWEPGTSGSLNDGDGETSSAITVTGASLGDFVTVAAPYDLKGALVHGYVSAADTVKIRIQNETGATIVLSSGDWRVRVFAQE